MSDYPDLSNWPERVDPSNRDRPSDEERELLAQVDIRQHGLPVHEYLAWDRAADGSVTLSVPWSDIRFTAPPGSTDIEAKRGFMDAYIAVFRGSEEERDAFGRFYDAEGYLSAREIVRRREAQP